MKKLYCIQSIVLCLVGTGALFGGGMAIYDPYGVLYGIPVDALKKGPFTNFLIPGLFLFFFIGVGSLISFAAVKRRHKLHPYFSGASGCILMGWIIVQCYILRSVYYLHIIFFILGLLESIIALYTLVKLRLYPFSHDIGKNLEG